MNQLTPKQRFLASGHAAKHLDWSRSEHGKAAIEATIAAMAAFYKGPDLIKLEGAVVFAELLLNLSEPDKERKPVESSTLKY